MTTPSIDTHYTREELRDKIEQMRAAANVFYSLAVDIAVHPFIEHTGLMNEYIKLCEQALEAGIDYTQCNTHTGQSLPILEYNASYLGEKMNCIYGPSFVSNKEALRAFVGALTEGQFKPWHPTDPKTKLRDPIPGLDTITIMVATSTTGTFAMDGRIPWHSPADLKRFATVTKGGILIMGRKTWETLPERKDDLGLSCRLPGRHCLVITRSPQNYDGSAYKDTTFCQSLGQALQHAGVLKGVRTGARVFVIGGGAIYNELLEHYRAGRLGWNVDIDHTVISRVATDHPKDGSTVQVLDLDYLERYWPIVRASDGDTPEICSHYTRWPAHYQSALPVVWARTRTIKKKDPQDKQA